MRTRPMRSMHRIWVLALAALPACECSSTSTPADAGTTMTDASGTGSIACFAADALTCKEFPAPTADDRANLTVACSSGSGTLSATCPSANFGGKCTRPATERYVERFYNGTGADLAYDQDFCVNTAHGTWSTTF